MDANRALGLPDDCREYTSVRNMLLQMGVKSIRLIVSASGTRQGLRVLPAPPDPAQQRDEWA